MWLPSMLQPAFNSATALGSIQAAVVHMVKYIDYTSYNCHVKPVTFLLLLLSQTLEAILASLGL